MSEDAPRYAGRSAEIAVLNLSLDREAATLLRHLAPTTKSYGRFVSRLIYEHQARLEERQRILRGMQQVLTEER